MSYDIFQWQKGEKCLNEKFRRRSSQETILNGKFPRCLFVQHRTQPAICICKSVRWKCKLTYPFTSPLFWRQSIDRSKCNTTLLFFAEQPCHEHGIIFDRTWTVWTSLTGGHFGLARCFSVCKKISFDKESAKWNPVKFCLQRTPCNNTEQLVVLLSVVHLS